jgi:hypothetical protein
MKFGGNELEFILIDNDVILRTKQMEGKFSQLKSFVDNLDKIMAEEHQVEFGLHHTKPVEPNYITYDLDAWTITIGCSTDSIQNCIEIYKECENILGIKNRFA